jgi:UDP:flavonoid glycosyltransferase YjiC (YdhE family)
MLSGEAFPSAQAAAAAALAWRSILRATRADLLVADHAPLALLAARGEKIKVATFGTPFSMPMAGRPLPLFGKDAPQADETKLLARLNAALDALRAPRLEGAADLYRVDAALARTIAETDCFAPRPAADYVAPTLEDSGPAVPAWPEGGGPRVLAYLTPGELLHSACEALAAHHARGIVCVPKGNEKLADELARPGLLVTSEHCRFSELIEQADAVVCHGGHNTVVGSLLAGKPLVMIPQHMEQAMTAARVVALGAGVVPAGKPAARVLTRCLEYVDPASAAQASASRLAARYRRKDTAGRPAADRLAALLG